MSIAPTDNGQHAAPARRGSVAILRAAEQLFGSLSAQPDRAALEFAGRTVTYGDLDRLSARFAAGLSAKGIADGDTIAVRMENSPEMVAALLGAFRAGAVCVPLNPALTREETGHILTDSSATLTIGRTGSRTDEVHVTFEEGTWATWLFHRRPT